MKKYWYQLVARPADSFTTPDCEGREFREQNLPRWAKRGHGQVGYNNPLSVEEIKRFELIPITVAKELHGKRAVVWGQSGSISVDENCYIFFDFDGEHDTKPFPYLVFFTLATFIV